MAFPVIGGTQESGYNIDNSLRFNDGDSAYLSRTMGTPTSTRIWTYSGWHKRSVITDNQNSFLSWGGATYATDLRYEASSDYLYFYFDDNTGYYAKTKAVYRDVSAWYHVVLAIDTTQATESNRLKLYINGTQYGPALDGTDWTLHEIFPQNYDFPELASGQTMAIGKRNSSGSHFFDGYMSDVYFIDGQQLTPSEFGETDDNGVWIPKNYTGSYGTNGFKLEFKQLGTAADATSIGADTSGNDNHFSQTNVTPAVDRTEDTPTNNFATLNIINKFNSPVVAEGALEFDSNSSSGSSLISTIAPSSGKWYVEVKALTSTIHIGVGEVGKEAFNVKGLGASRPNINYQYGGGVEIDGSIIDTEATFTTNDIIGIALNLDDGEVTFYKNGTALNSGTAYNLHTNTIHGNTGFGVQTATGSGNTKASFNFGNPAFSISSGNSDANGYGNFEYAVPSGYYSLCLKNLAEYG